jgi:integrase/recombinase XerD
MSKTVARNIARPTGRASPDATSLYAADGGRKYLNRDERCRVLAAIAGLEPDRALFALTLAWTGARVSEVLALTPASFQIERGLVSVRTLKRRAPRVREVPLPPQLVEALDRQFHLSAAQREIELASQRIWPWCRQTAWRVTKAAMGQAGVFGRPACPRGLRHGFGVGALQASVPLNLVQRWLGHARISTTAIYADASGPEEQGFAARFWNL